MLQMDVVQNYDSAVTVPSMMAASLQAIFQTSALEVASAFVFANMATSTSGNMDAALAHGINAITVGELGDIQCYVLGNTVMDISGKLFGRINADGDTINLAGQTVGTTVKVRFSVVES